MAEVEPQLKPLTPKQKNFALAYLRCGFCAARAARETGTPARSAKQVGFAMLNLPQVRAYIDTLCGDVGLSEAVIKQVLSEAATFDITEFLDENGAFNLKLARERGITNSLVEIQYHGSRDGKGVKALKGPDKLKAAELLGKAKGMFTDKVEMSGAGGGPIAFNVIPPETNGD